MVSSFEVLICFVDGSEKVIKGATDYCLDPEKSCFVITKNEYRIFVPSDKVLYLGRKIDIKE